MPPHLTGPDDLNTRVLTLIDTGAAGDRGQIYWLARLSDRYPTVELRCFDVQLRIADAVTLAGLVRALVTAALADSAARQSYPVRPGDVVRAACWAAARHGLDGALFDLRVMARRPARDVLADLLARLEAGSQAGPRDGADDLDRVRQGLRQLAREGTGAARQRAAVRALGMDGLTTYVAEQSVR